MMKRLTVDELTLEGQPGAYAGTLMNSSVDLLRSIRNVPISDADDEIDVSYDKELSRRLLIENVVLRRDAEMKAKFPTKTLLADLEPFLIDIANLPDQAKPEDLRAIKERVQKSEIVAALLEYQDKGQDKGPMNFLRSC